MVVLIDDQGSLGRPPNSVGSGLIVYSYQVLSLTVTPSCFKSRPTKKIVKGFYELLHYSICINSQRILVSDVIFSL